VVPFAEKRGLPMVYKGLRVEFEVKIKL